MYTALYPSRAPRLGGARDVFQYPVVLTEARIVIQARRSRRLPLIIGCAYFIAAIVLLATPVAGWWMVCALTGLAAGLCWQFALLRRQAISVTLEIGADGACRWHGGRRDCSGILRADSTVCPWLIVLGIDVPQSRRARRLLLLPDSMCAEEWRRLRVFLRWGVRFGAASEPSGGLY